MIKASAATPRIHNPFCGRRELTPTNCPPTPCVPCVHSGAHAQRINKMQCHFFFCLKREFKTSLDTLVRLSGETRWYTPVTPTCKKVGEITSSRSSSATQSCGASLGYWRTHLESQIGKNKGQIRSLGACGRDVI